MHDLMYFKDTIVDYSKHASGTPNSDMKTPTTDEVDVATVPLPARPLISHMNSM